MSSLTPAIRFALSVPSFGQPAYTTEGFPVLCLVLLGLNPFKDSCGLLSPTRFFAEALHKNATKTVSGSDPNILNAGLNFFHAFRRTPAFTMAVAGMFLAILHQFFGGLSPNHKAAI
jgi:hypothetical protein